MSFLLDTNICSALVKKPGPLFHRVVQHGGGLFMPTIVLGELYAWAHRRPDPQHLISAIEQGLLVDVTVLDFDRACALEFGRLRGLMLDQGTPVNPVDIMIAAVALVHDLTLVTHNTKHFEPVPGLRIVDWLAK